MVSNPILCCVLGSSAQLLWTNHAAMRSGMVAHFRKSAQDMGKIKNKALF
jgi:hypothetical protein